MSMGEYVIQPYPALAVTRDVTQDWHTTSKKQEKFKNDQKIPARKRETINKIQQNTSTNSHNLPYWASTLPDDIVKYGRKAPASAKRTRGHLINAEKPNDAIFWKSRGVKSATTRPKPQEVTPKVRPKSHAATYPGHQRENLHVLNRPKTCKSEVVSTKETKRTELNVDILKTFGNESQENIDYFFEEHDPDTVNPSHLLDVLESENVAVPTTGCYSVLSDISTTHVNMSSPTLRPKAVELVVMGENNLPVQAKFCPVPSVCENTASGQVKTLVSDNIKPLPKSEKLQKQYVKGTQHYLKKRELSSKSRSYIGILDSLRDKYAFDIVTEKSPSSPKTITISNIGEATQLTSSPRQKPSNNVNKQRFPPLQVYKNPANSPHSAGVHRMGHDDGLGAYCLTPEDDIEAVPMVVEIRTVSQGSFGSITPQSSKPTTIPYVPPSQFYKATSRSKGSHSFRNDDNTYDVQRERKYNMDFMSRRVGNFKLLRTTAPCNTPQPGFADTVDIS